MARLSQAELAAATRLSLETVKRLERIRGPIRANPRTLAALEEALLGAGVRIERRSDGSIALVSHSVERPVVQVIVPSSMPAEPASLHRLIYYSTAARPAAADELAPMFEDILRHSVRRNAELGVTGCLTASAGRFMQALEGSRAAVMQVYGSIAADPRHRDLVVVESRRISSRRFADWVMCARPAVAEELTCADPSQAGGFHPEALSPAACLGVLAWLADLESRELNGSASAGVVRPAGRS